MDIFAIENLQRKDLDIFEDGWLESLNNLYDYTTRHSRENRQIQSTITEIISVSRIPSELRDD
jgi:hypothetical protein